MRIHKVLTYLFIACLILSLTLPLQAQDETVFKSRLKTLSGDTWKEMFIADITFGAFSEFVNPGVLNWDKSNNNNFKVYPVPETIQYIGLFSVGSDLRLNLVEYFDMASLSVNLPITFTLNAMTEGSDEPVVSGTFPLILQVNAFAGSTKQKLDKVGFYVGAGYLYHRRFGNADMGFDDDVDSHNSGYPVVRVGFNIDRKNKGLSGISITYGLSNTKITYSPYAGATETIYSPRYFSMRLHYYFF